MRDLNIVIIGSGMYTCGCGTEGYGTIMPALLEWKKKKAGGNVYIAGTGPKSIEAAKVKIKKLKKRLGDDTLITYFPKDGRRNTVCYKEAIKDIPGPACAIIAVPDRLHAKIASYAINSGLHTLVVKPLAPTLKEVKGLIEAQDRHQVYCAVEFHKRFDHANLKLKDTLSCGAIGEPLYFLVEYSQRKSIPLERFKAWVDDTNVFQYLGIHYADIIYFATGALPKRAMAIGQKGWLRSKGIDAYDSIQAVIEWKMPSGSRFCSHILTNWIDPEKTSAMSDQKIKVIGTKGRFESDQKARGIRIVTDENGIEEPNPYFCSSYGAAGSASYKGYGIESICRFLDDVVSIEEGRRKVRDLEETRPTFRQSVVPTMVLEAVNRSLKNRGVWVEIENG